jgi:hypothetical protein
MYVLAMYSRRRRGADTHDYRIGIGIRHALAPQRRSSPENIGSGDGMQALGSLYVLAGPDFVSRYPTPVSRNSMSGCLLRDTYRQRGHMKAK